MVAIPEAWFSLGIVLCLRHGAKAHGGLQLQTEQVSQLQAGSTTKLEERSVVEDPQELIVSSGLLGLLVPQMKALESGEATRSTL